MKIPSVNTIGVILFASVFSVFVAYMIFRQAGGANTRRLEAEAHFDSGIDRFPDRALVKYARWFSIRYFNNYKIVEVVNPFGAFRDTLRYLLIPRGEARPPGFAGAQVVEIPIRSMVCLSTTHIGLTGFLGVNHLVVGMSDTAFILNPEVKRLAQDGKITEVGHGDVINNELVLNMRPDLLLAVGFSGRDLSAYRTMSQSGIGVVSQFRMDGRLSSCPDGMGQAAGRFPEYGRDGGAEIQGRGKGISGYPPYCRGGEAQAEGDQRHQPQRHLDHTGGKKHCRRFP